MTVRDDAAYWACPHGYDARHGCAPCYQLSGDAEPTLPIWEVAVWFEAHSAIPVRTLKEVRRHGRNYLLDQLSATRVYLLTGHARAAGGAQAVAALVGFLRHDGHLVDGFTVRDFRAVRLDPPPGLPRPDRIWP
ncbi:hypothetical protein Sru01_27490 [Sphaerisporangium rufum]|uniref:Uncharacterized protein n=1 Tax=Sphaerisporangium rufum TaxID=1381558 RepID=A0A919R5Z5_9ACTN|nr:hypothetical protein [Sphaerisporangium rufum]GII77767.1 hypothetical protein Sru01_27490 [Sphaerisporangium rufum]